MTTEPELLLPNYDLAKVNDLSRLIDLLYSQSERRDAFLDVTRKILLGLGVTLAATYVHWSLGVATLAGTGYTAYAQYRKADALPAVDEEVEQLMRRMERQLQLESVMPLKVYQKFKY